MSYRRTLPTQITKLEELVEYVTAELSLIERGFNSLQLATLYAEPARPRDGMIVLADGTAWNPGSGAGYYGYYGGSWAKLG